MHLRDAALNWTEEVLYFHRTGIHDGNVPRVGTQRQHGRLKRIGLKARHDPCQPQPFVDARQQRACLPVLSVPDPKRVA